MKKPMGLTSTHFISYHDIKVEDADLIEDAFGFNRDFRDVISILRSLKYEPGANLTKKLVARIKDHNR